VASRRLPLSWVVAATVAVLVVAAAVVVLSGGDGGDDFATPDEVRALPIATLVEGSNDDDSSLGDLLDDGGRPMVVNLFASWCAPCIEEMPDFEQVHRDLGDEVAITGLAVRNPPEDALGIVERTGVTYPTFADTDDRASNMFDVVNLPTTVFLDADGTVLDVHTGELSESELRAELDERYGVAS
jgi:cytochrome c biogenesis protein CcmG/thiol:disulfide interchange protein DsbE